MYTKSLDERLNALYATLTADIKKILAEEPSVDIYDVIGGVETRLRREYLAPKIVVNNPPLADRFKLRRSREPSDERLALSVKLRFYLSLVARGVAPNEPPFLTLEALISRFPKLKVYSYELARDLLNELAYNGDIERSDDSYRTNRRYEETARPFGARGNRNN